MVPADARRSGKGSWVPPDHEPPAVQGIDVEGPSSPARQREMEKGPMGLEPHRTLFSLDLDPSTAMVRAQAHPRRC